MPNISRIIVAPARPPPIIIVLLYGEEELSVSLISMNVCLKTNLNRHMNSIENRPCIMAYCHGILSLATVSVAIVTMK